MRSSLMSFRFKTTLAEKAAYLIAALALLLSLLIAYKNLFPQ